MGVFPTFLLWKAKRPQHVLESLASPSPPPGDPPFHYPGLHQVQSQID